jgi:excisionase family DNA binding protein
MAEWITTKQAAELSGYHVNHIRRIVRAGLVSSQKFGPTLQIDRRSLLAYVKAAEKSDDARRGAKSRG